MTEFTVADLIQIMRACAGVDDAVGLGDDVAETEFEQLGYDSLALLETASRVSREYGVTLPEEELAEIRTPAAFVALVNQLRARPEETELKATG
jgi:minimal PKS acyl carrier protein